MATHSRILAWRALVHGITKSWTWLQQLSTRAQTTENMKVLQKIKNRKLQPTPVLLPQKSHGPRSVVAYRPWDCKESDSTERLHFHFSLSRIGEGNDNLLQCSCLKNPRDGVAWWAAVYGVAQSQTQLKRLSSSSIRVFSNESVLHIR